jgi:hypothetical protein
LVKSGWYLRDVLVLILGNTTGFGAATLISFAFTDAEDLTTSFLGASFFTGTGFAAGFFTSIFLVIGLCAGFLTAAGFFVAAFAAGLTVFFVGIGFLGAGFAAFAAGRAALWTGLAGFLATTFLGAGFFAEDAFIAGFAGFFAAFPDLAGACFFVAILSLF